MCVIWNICQLYNFLFHSFSRGGRRRYNNFTSIIALFTICWCTYDLHNNNSGYGQSTSRFIPINIKARYILHSNVDKYFGFNGFIYAQPITDVLMVVISILILRKIINKDHKLEQLKAKEVMMHKEQITESSFWVVIR